MTSVLMNSEPVQVVSFLFPYISPIPNYFWLRADQEKSKMIGSSPTPTTEVASIIKRLRRAARWMGEQSPRKAQESMHH